MTDLNKIGIACAGAALLLLLIEAGVPDTWYTQGVIIVFVIAMICALDNTERRDR